MKTLEMIVPCFNEEESIEHFFEEISKVFEKLSESFACSVIFVDDGSKDNSLKIIKELAASHKNVKYISFSRNFGKEGAMLAGLSYSSADFVGLIDADLQHDPALIIDMAHAIDEEGFDIAAARRTDRSGEGKFKSLLSSLFYKFSNSITEIQIDEGAQDFRLMTRQVVETILSLPENDRFTKGIFSFIGFSTKWFEHENAKRIAGTSKWNIKQLFQYAISGIVSFSSVLLKLPTIFGALSFICGIIFLICAIALKSSTMGIVSAILLIGGLILISLGIIGIYLYKLFKEAKQRPAFIVKSTNITATLDKKDNIR